LKGYNSDTLFNYEVDYLLQCSKKVDIYPTIILHIELITSFVIFLPFMDRLRVGSGRVTIFVGRVGSGRVGSGKFDRRATLHELDASRDVWCMIIVGFNVPLDTDVWCVMMTVLEGVRSERRQARRGTYVQPLHDPSVAAAGTVCKCSSRRVASWSESVHVSRAPQGSFRGGTRGNAVPIVKVFKNAQNSSQVEKKK